MQVGGLLATWLIGLLAVGPIPSKAANGVTDTEIRIGASVVLRAMESAGEISFGKFAARYSPQSHNGSSYVELAIIDTGGKLRY